MSPADSAPIPQTKQDAAGHRARLRQRFLKGGGAALQDYEFLELLLFSAIPRRDVKPLAKSLLREFKTLQGVLTATPEQLMKQGGLSETAAVSLGVVRAAAEALTRSQVLGQSVISSWQQLVDYLMIAMGHESKEGFRLLFLDKRNRVIADEQQQSGTVDHTPVYPREVVKRALEHGATALILVHNHPSGDPTPSQEDIDMTRALIRAAQPVGLTIHDHVIVSRTGYRSFRSLGLI